MNVQAYSKKEKSQSEKDSRVEAFFFFVGLREDDAYDDTRRTRSTPSFFLCCFGRQWFTYMTPLGLRQVTAYTL